MIGRGVVQVRLLFVSQAGERIFHRQGKCSGKLCPLKPQRRFPRSKQLPLRGPDSDPEEAA